LHLIQEYSVAAGFTPALVQVGLRLREVRPREASRTFLRVVDGGRRIQRRRESMYGGLLAAVGKIGDLEDTR
jgi:hypothetical protein